MAPSSIKDILFKIIIQITENHNDIPPGIDFNKTFLIKLPFTKLVFGCKAKKNDGKPITANSRR